MSKTKQLLHDLHLGTVNLFWFVAAQPVLFTLRKEKSCIKFPQGHHHSMALGTPFLQQIWGCWDGGKQPVWGYSPPAAPSCCLPGMGDVLGAEFGWVQASLGAGGLLKLEEGAELSWD